MRLSLMGLALAAVIGLTPASVTAEEGTSASATVVEATPPSSAAEGWSRTSRFHYETCNCHFGYGDSCQVAVALGRQSVSATGLAVEGPVELKRTISSRDATIAPSQTATVPTARRLRRPVGI